MIQLSCLTPVVLAFNEEPNITRCLESLRWARRVVVVDSGSTDRTLETVANFPNATVAERAFDDHASQWNFGLVAVETPWVLTLDADYRITKELIEEIKNTDIGDTDCFELRFEYHVFGRPLRSCIYPPRPALFRVGNYRYRMDGHTQRLYPDSRHPRLKSPIIVDDRKGLSRWLENQAIYADKEVTKLKTSHWSTLSFADRLRARVLLAPAAMLVYCLVRKGLILDGWRGVFYTAERVVAELILSLALLRDLFATPCDEAVQDTVPNSDF